jgi:hypothetical protein
MAKPPVKAYQGDEPFIFVSYAHRDSDIVYRAVEQLCAAYFRVWYDEGIEPGRIWKTVLDQRVRDSHCVLVFLSPQATASEHVIGELLTAQTHGKQIFPVYLAPTSLPDSISEYILSHQTISLQEAESSGLWTGLIESLPPETKQFMNSEQQLRYIEKGLRDPIVMSLLRDRAQDDLGWCSVQRRGSPYNDFLQTCKLCGDTDWFEAKGLGSPGPAKHCWECGLSRDPGRAKPWFEIIERDGANVQVRCTECGSSTLYAYDDGPPLICPKCGRLQYE